MEFVVHAKDILAFEEWPTFSKNLEIFCPAETELWLKI